MTTEILNIEPNVGIGPVKLGMSRKDVRRTMMDEFGAKPNDPKQSANTDYYLPDNSIRVSYDEGTVDYIDVSESMLVEFHFEGVDVFTKTCAELVAHVGQFEAYDEELSNPPSEYCFRDFVLTMSEPKWDDDNRCCFDAIGVGDSRYLANQLAVAETERDLIWSQRHKPAKKYAKAIKKLRSVNADVAVDSAGEVIGVQFFDWDLFLLSNPIGQNARDNSLDVIGSFPAIRELLFSGDGGITADGIARIDRLPNLEAFALYSGDCGNAVINMILHSPNLKRLVLPHGATPDRLAKLKKLKNLTELSFPIEPDNLPESIDVLASIPKLRQLKIRRIRSAVGLEKLSALTHLDKLDLDVNHELPPKELKKLQEAIQRVVGDE